MFDLKRSTCSLNNSFTAYHGDSKDGTIYRCASFGCQKDLVDKLNSAKKYLITMEKGGVFVKICRDKTANYFDLGFEKSGRIILYSIVSDMPALILHSKLHDILAELFWALMYKKKISKNLLYMCAYALEYYYYADNLSNRISLCYTDEPYPYRIPATKDNRYKDKDDDLDEISFT